MDQQNDNPVAPTTITPDVAQNLLDSTPADVVRPLDQAVVEAFKQDILDGNFVPQVIQAADTPAPVVDTPAAIAPVDTPAVPQVEIPYLMTSEEVLRQNRSLEQPILHYRKNDDDVLPLLPDRGMYYVLASNGLFLHKDNLVANAIVQIQKFEEGGWNESQTIDFLEPLKVSIKPLLPKIPARIIGQASIFFRKIVHKFRSESALILFFNKQKNEFLLWCPMQQVSHGGVNYTNLIQQMQADGRNPQKDGYHQVGTIHSHCDFNAFHSGTDTRDESRFDGIHITLGHNDKVLPVNGVKTNVFSMVSSIAINNNRVQLNPEDVCYGIARVDKVEPAQPQFTTPPVATPDSQWTPPAHGVGIGFRYGQYGQGMNIFQPHTQPVYNNYDNNDYFCIADADQSWMAADEAAINSFWVPKVQKMVYQNQGGSQKKKFEWPGLIADDYID